MTAGEDAQTGDWIVKDGDRFYALRPDVFASLFAESI